jgi:hypothetical protein
MGANLWWDILGKLPNVDLVSRLSYVLSAQNGSWNRDCSYRHDYRQRLDGETLTSNSRSTAYAPCRPCHGRDESDILTLQLVFMIRFTRVVLTILDI